MNPRWYISTLVIILSFLGGITHQQQDTSPNQELVLQFSSHAISSEEALNVIGIVKQQLQSAGVQNIQVLDQEEGRLKISYYSASGVERIKKILSKQDIGTLGVTSYEDERSHGFPSEEQSFSYNFDVYEIQQGNDILGFNGKMALEQKSGSDRFSNPNDFVSIENPSIEHLERLFKITYNCTTAIGLVSDNKSHKIPEVRAGPKC